MLIPRWYQEEAIAALYRAVCKPNPGNPLVVMQTGTGKSLIPAEFMRRLLSTWGNLRFLSITHVQELVIGNYKAARTQMPVADMGIYHAGLNRKQSGNQIVFCGVASVVKNVEQFGHRDIIFLDEAHMLSDKQATMYQKVFSKLREINPKLIICGLTATPYRLGTGSLVDGNLFTHICYDCTDFAGWSRLLEDGYLSPLITKRTEKQFNVSRIKKVAGDFVQSALAVEMERDDGVVTAVKEIISYGMERKHWLIFASGIDHAEHIRDVLRYQGVPAVALHGSTKRMEKGVTRANAFHGFETGQYRAMVTVGMATTGYNFPALDLIAHLRATTSTALWVQMNGRGTRPAEGKTNCLVLDFVGNTARLGAVNDPVIPTKKKNKKGDAPVKLCEYCGCINHASVRHCVDCEAEFPLGVPKLLKNASTDEIMVTDHKPCVEEFPVELVTYQLSRKRVNKPRTIQVTYHCGNRHFKEWLCLEHTSYAGSIAREWWLLRARGGENYIPQTSEDAMLYVDSLIQPLQIRVWTNKKMPEILAYYLTDKWVTT